MVVLGQLTRWLVIDSRSTAYVSSDHRRRSGQPGFQGFNICTQPPVEEPAKEGEQLLFTRGVRFYAEGDPIPLPDLDDLTGTRLVHRGAVRPQVRPSACFTLYVCEHQHVTHVRLRFLERRGEQYRITVSALAHNLFAKPAELAFETWIPQQAAIRYGASD